MKKGLSPKQSAFCREFVKLNEGKAAAIKAGYAKSTAESMASKLLASNKKVQAEVKRLRDKAEDKALIDREEIIREWRKIAFSNITKTRNEHDEALTLCEMPEEVSAAVEELAEIETQIGTSRRIKMHSKPAALKELSKLGGLYPEEGTGEGVKLIFQFGGTVADDN